MSDDDAHTHYDDQRSGAEILAAADEVVAASIELMAAREREHAAFRNVVWAIIEELKAETELARLRRG